MQSEISLHWYETVILIAALITAARVIWLKIFRPVIHILVVIEKFYPLIEVITDIALEFKPNGGNSLRDRIEHLQMDIDNISNRLDVIASIKKAPHEQ